MPWKKAHLGRSRLGTELQEVAMHSLEQREYTQGVLIKKVLDIRLFLISLMVFIKHLELMVFKDPHIASRLPLMLYTMFLADVLQCRIITHINTATNSSSAIRLMLHTF